VMSARPGRLLEIIETGWPAGRDSTIVEKPEFGQVTARLWQWLRVESMKSVGRAERP
jgi:NitT/TauT family transport system ATP-binding protein